MNTHELSPPVFPFSWASQWGEDQFGLWMVLEVGTIPYVFRWIEPGSFMMGSEKSEKGRFDREDLHQVHLSKGFWIGETTVTQNLWQVVMGKNPSRFKGELLPVEEVNWDDVKAFNEKVNKLHPELSIRLPWEAEWEYACRAGSQTPFSFEGEIDLSKVNYSGEWDSLKASKDILKKTAPVRRYPANAWGLFEMHGNVYEWCEDIFQESLGSEPVTDPFFHSAGAESGDKQARRVLRGGSWINFGRFTRSASRSRGTPDGRNINIGFRLVQGPGAQGGAATR